MRNKALKNGLRNNRALISWEVKRPKTLHAPGFNGWYAEPLIGLDLIGLVLIGLDLICLVLIGYQY